VAQGVGIDRARCWRRELERGCHVGNVARQAFTVHMGQSVALNSHYKGFPTFVKQKSIVVNRAAIDHET
jgi:hypothetical protein